MRLLIKTALILAAVFASTFLIIKLTGILSAEDIKLWFQTIKSQPSYQIGGLVIVLLFADLFVAVPTMTVVIFAGYFLGFQVGALYAFLGLASAAFTGYLLSRVFGERLLNKLTEDELQKQQMRTLFQNHGVPVLILCRAMPMLPEIASCLAGTCNMPISRFLLGWGLGTIPYLMIISYAGSISDFDNPKPVLLSALAVTGTLWLVWLWFIKVKIRSA
ncbi:MAG: VTT domain-containing protein [Candidatus Thiodiazotropha sp. (ex Epidulcina cf. delphinae)]|nr:VTT domain-containing protein [Candidatus Thiodiazotropha sp. (ex Epidulcina cf. delphinae)]